MNVLVKCINENQYALIEWLEHECICLGKQIYPKSFNRSLVCRSRKKKQKGEAEGKNRKEEDKTGRKRSKRNEK